MELRKNAKLELLRQVPLFAQLSRKQLAEVAAIADELDVAAGKALTREGQPGREFFVIVEGTVDIERGGRPVRRLRAGDFLGEIALLTRAPRTATAVAVTPLRALVIRDREFRALLQHAPELQLQVLQALAERLAATEL